MTIVGFSAIGLVAIAPTLASATDVAAKQVFIKDNATPSKRLVLVLSKDAAVKLAQAGDPRADGASIHAYSVTDELCVLLPAGADWKQTRKAWKYRSKATKGSAQIGDGKLAATIRSSITYSLADNGTQGHVNVQVQFGKGTRYCLRCSGNKKDDPKKFIGKNCAAAACDPAPSTCGAAVTTTSATTTTTSATTTTASTTNGSSTTSTTAPAGAVLKGALPPTGGRFNYNMTLGVPGANAACNTNFPGTHACTYTELQAAQVAGDLGGLKDTANNTVTSFWAIDPGQPPLSQCQDDVVGGSGLDWEYATAHTASRGQKVALNNGAGTLGALQSGIQCNISGTNWVGCCQ